MEDHACCAQEPTERESPSAKRKRDAALQIRDKRRQKSRINIGVAITRWKALLKDKCFQRDAELSCLFSAGLVYKTGSDSFDTYDQHYGRGLGKETVREGLSKFFCNGEVLRKDAVTGSVLRVQKILEWFEGQSQLSFYASSLLFVYEGACPPGVVCSDSRLAPEACEQNNNIARSLSAMFSLHKKAWVRSHYQAKQDNGVWASTQQPNGNRGLPGLRQEGEELKSDAAHDTGGDMEVKMIDFAHVFPSDGQDQGYIYGLKNLLKVLRQILEE